MLAERIVFSQARPTWQLGPGSLLGRASQTVHAAHSRLYSPWQDSGQWPGHQHLGVAIPAIDINTRSRILYAYALQRKRVGQLGDQFIKIALNTLEEPEEACPGMGGAARSNMEMEPRYAWCSAAVGPAP